MTGASTSARIVARDVEVEVQGAVLLTATSLDVSPSEVVAVMGPSGCGKTTLLRCLSGTLVPTRGQVQVAGVTISDLTPKERSTFRRERVGLVFQDPELLNELTVAENVALPMLFSGVSRSVAETRAASALARVGLDGFGGQRISRLSGGEAQRAAIARALASSQGVILADEPTAALDIDNARNVTQLLVDAARQHATAVVLATHDVEVAARCDRIVHLRESVMVAG